jgi:hypothetical protein
MNGIMEKIRQLMAGRYGNDFLNAVLFIFGAVISVVCSLFRIPFGSLISFIPYGIALYRMLSKDYTKRSAENARFLELSKPWRDFLMKKLKGGKSNVQFLVLPTDLKRWDAKRERAKREVVFSI